MFDVATCLPCSPNVIDGGVGLLASVGVIKPIANISDSWFVAITTDIKTRVRVIPQIIDNCFLCMIKVLHIGNHCMVMFLYLYSCAYDSSMRGLQNPTKWQHHS